MPHAINLFINRCLFFNIGIGSRNIGFRLIVVIIGDEIFDRIVWKEGFHLAIKLRRQGLIGGQD